MNFNIVGSGSWGIAFANLLSNKNFNVTVLHRNSVNSKRLVQNSIHPNLPSIKISKKIKYTTRFSDLEMTNIFVLAIPSDTIYSFISKYDLSNQKILILTKGIDTKSKLLISDLLISKFSYNPRNIFVLSGPNHAEEILMNKPSTTILASKNKSYSKKIQKMISSNTFRVYTSDDITGVQVGGAVKNVIAIASGICEGLNLGDNAQASLVTRGLHEILQLSKVYKFNPITIYGLSGLGDLACTCYSDFSRNKNIGKLLSKGNSLSKSKNEIGMISEGVITSKVLHEIIKKNRLYMPICTEVFNIIYKQADIKKSMVSLMDRTLKDEK